MSLKKSYLLSMAAITLLSNCSCDKKNNTKTNLETKTTTEPKNKDSDIMQPTIHHTASGLGYEIITPGTGAKPQKGQTVVVHYTGWLDDNGQPGKKFDSSVDRGTPFSTQIGVGRVIPGWDEGLLDMQVGEKRRLFIPADLGYGKYGAGAAIPPNANLIFDVELIAIK